MQLAYPQADRADGQEALPCCQLGLGRQRQQCGLAAANRAAASWRANRLNERRSTKVEWNVQCRLTGEHFEKIIVGNGHQRAVHGRPLTGIGNKFDLLAPYCADEGATIEGVQTWPQLVLHLGLLCQIKCVIDLDSKIAHRAFNFSVSK